MNEIMSETTTIPGVEPAPEARTRNVLNLSAAFKLGQWLPDEDLSQYSTHAELAAAATTAVGSLVTEANMRTVLRQVGLEGKFEEERGRAERVRRAAPKMLAALLSVQKFLENEAAEVAGVTVELRAVVAAIDAAEAE